MSLRLRNAARCSALLTAATAITALTSGTAGASNLPAPTHLPAAQFTLTSDYHKYDAINNGLTGRLPISPVHTVMDHANLNREPLDMNPKPAGVAGGFQFDETDNGDCRNYPQGITTSRDAVGSTNGGTYDGHQLVAVSWYTKDKCGDTGKGVRSRITLADWDATYPDKYRKILLVEPTGSFGSPDFTDIPIHAGGISWYGDYLYVADTSGGMRVFDMRKILEVNTDGPADQIGRHGDKFYAHKYRYVLPQVGTISSHVASGDTKKLTWSTISLDRAKPSIVMTEYTCKPEDTPKSEDACKPGDTTPAGKPRAVRFPFAPGTELFAPKTVATEALTLPWYKINGVGSHNGRWWFNSSGAKILYYWSPREGSAAHDWNLPFGESISYWEDPNGADLLWTLQEGKGNRNVFAVKQATYGG